MNKLLKRYNGHYLYESNFQLDYVEISLDDNKVAKGSHKHFNVEDWGWQHFKKALHVTPKAETDRCDELNEEVIV